MPAGRVEVDPRLAELLRPFGSRFIKITPPVEGDGKSGKRPLEAEWQKHPYDAEDPDFLEHLETGGNYGVKLGDGLIVVEQDAGPELDLPGTFTVRSGSGRGHHYYFESEDIVENGVLLDGEGGNVGNVQVRNKQVVGPGSKHNSGGMYQIVKDVPLARLSKAVLEKAAKKNSFKVSWAHEKEAEDEAVREGDRISDQIPIEEIVDVSKLDETSPGEWQGAHPVHGSTTGQNFTVSAAKNCWHCFRCNSGGGPLSWIAVEAGIIKCEEARPGKLRGELFKKAIEAAEERGFLVYPIEPLSFKIERGLSLDDVRGTVDYYFKDLWNAVEIVMSAAALLFIRLNKPFMVVLVGPSGAAKSTVLDMFPPMTKMTILADDITAASFITQKSEAVDEDELAAIDFLPKIKDKILITPELSPIFSAQADQLRKVIGVWTRILDGQGYVRAAGTHGLRGKREDMQFIWLAGTVPFPWRVWQEIANMGPRMYFTGMKADDPKEGEIVEGRKKGGYSEKVIACRRKVWSFMICLKEDLGPDFKWDVASDNDAVMLKIERFARLLARLRGQVIVKEERDGQYRYWTPVVELPYKPFDALYDLARGHALICGRTKIEEEDLLPVVNVALHSAPTDRVHQFRLILENGVITIGELAELLNCSYNAAARTIMELRILRLVENVGKAEQTNQRGPKAKLFKLHGDLEWFLGEEFDVLRKRLGIEIESEGAFREIKHKGPGKSKSPELLPSRSPGEGKKGDQNAETDKEQHYLMPRDGSNLPPGFEEGPQDIIEEELTPDDWLERNRREEP